VRIVFRDYPLIMHRVAYRAAEAAHCADEQGKFWEMHDAIFQNQDRWAAASGNTKPDKVFKDLARQIGLKADQFDQCVDSKKYQAKIQAHAKLGDERHANGTPTFVIGDSMVAYPLPWDDFKDGGGQHLGFRSLVNVALAKAAASNRAPGAKGDSASRKGAAKTKR